MFTTFRVVSIFSKSHRHHHRHNVASISALFNITIERFKHTAGGGGGIKSPRSGRRESESTHHGKFDVGVETNLENDTTVDSVETTSLLDDK